MDEACYNSRAWDEEARKNNFWTIPAGKDEIERARSGEISVRLTPDKSVPLSWLEGMKKKRVLLLASAGGQQTPLLSAYGADVISVDISEEMVRRDNETLEKYGLKGKAVISDMRDLRKIESKSIDYVFSAHSINFISSLDGLYSEVARVLKKGGTFMFGAANPVLYIFDEKKAERKKLRVKYTLPFSDEKSRSEKELKRMIEKKDTFESSHTLESIISPLLDAGFVLTSFYSDSSLNEAVDSFISDSFLAFNFLYADPD